MKPLISHGAVGVVALGLGMMLGVAGASAPEETPSTGAPPAGTPRASKVTGVGGIFVKTDDAPALREWYHTHLGVGVAEGTFVFRWLEESDPSELGYTVWGVFPGTTDYFAPSEAPVMLNFRVADLEGLLASLRSEGVEIVGELEEYPNGKFAWILDPNGWKIELWEPVPSAEDPYIS